MRCRRARSPGADDDQRAFDGVSGGLARVLRVPPLDTQAGDESIDDDRLDPLYRGEVVAEIGRDRGNEMFEAILPAVGTEI